MTPRVRRYAEEAAELFGVTAEQILRKHKPRITPNGFTAHPASDARRHLIRRLRVEGFTVTQVGRWLGMDPSSVSYWTRGCGRRG